MPHYKVNIVVVVVSLPYIDINGTNIERITQAKVLCIISPPCLSWNARKDEIIAKVTKGVHMIYHLENAGMNQLIW